MIDPETVSLILYCCFKYACEHDLRLTASISSLDYLVVFEKEILNFKNSGSKYQRLLYLVK